MLLMTIGTFFYAIGFAAYGFVSTYVLFLAAMVIITIGEMIVSPTSSALVASLAPAEMRGRYMAVTGFSWIIPSMIGPLAAGLVMDNLNPNWVWYAGGILGLIATAGYLILSTVSSNRLSGTPIPEENP
jgi:MFS family permease